MSEVISSFKSLRAGSQVFALLMLFLCVILHNMWSGKSLQLLRILHFGMLSLSAISTAEYAAQVWARSAHAKNLDPELNQACR